MKPKRRIQLMILAAIAFGGLAWLMLYRPDEPDIAETIRKQGTNAVPRMLEMLRAKDLKFRTKLIELSERQNLIKFHFQTASDSYEHANSGFEILGTNAGFAAPALIKIVEENISQESRSAVSDALRAIGPSGTDAVLWFYNHQGKTNAEFRAWAILTLANTDLEPKRLLPLLIQSLKDSEPEVRRSAALDLLDMVREIGETDIRSAIPSLTEALNDPDVKVTKYAAYALKLAERAASTNAVKKPE